MTYNVHQHWDPLKVCAVGRSYPPEFYSFIKNSKARSVMERIAEETEEDYQSLIKLLHKFNVETVRTIIDEDFDSYIDPTGKYVPPPMCPRDYTAMVGNKFFMPKPVVKYDWDELRGLDWPKHPNEDLPDWVVTELQEIHGVNPTDKHLSRYVDHRSLKSIETLIQKQGNEIVYGTDINSAMTSRIGKDLYHGTDDYLADQTLLLNNVQKIFLNYRNHIINSGGHSDAVFCPVKPGLIISLCDIPTYKDTFPDWEVVYLPGQSWAKVEPFLELKEKNKGKFWVPGEERNDDFTNYVNEWLENWVGYVEETVFDVNMLVIDEKNVIVNNENDQVFEAFARHGITPHICNFRHRYFWDGGIHCITSDLHREGQQQDYFPERS
jgi:hypothetical protein